MDRLPRNSDHQYVVRRKENDSPIERRYEEYDTYNQPRTDTRLSSRKNYERNNQDSHYTYARQRVDDDHPTGDRRFRDSRHEDEREHVDIPIKTGSQFVVDNNRDINRRSNHPDQTQRTPKVDYIVNQNQPKPSANPRSFVIDVNITISVGSSGRNPQVTATTSNIRPRTPPIRSTAIIEDVGYVDLDLRSPERTARLATDGLIRSSPSKQTTYFSNENKK